VQPISRIRAHAQSLHVDVHLAHRQSRIAFDDVFYAIFDAYGDLADAGAVFDDDIQVNDNFAVNFFDFDPAPEIGTRQEGSHVLARVLGRHADDAVTFQDGKPGDTFDSVG